MAWRLLLVAAGTAVGVVAAGCDGDDDVVVAQDGRSEAADDATGTEADADLDSGADADADASIDAESDTAADAEADVDDGRPRLGDVDDEGRTLVWVDEFDGPEIDRSVWGNELGLVRNDEEQYYTDEPANQYVEDGKLVIAGLPGGHEGQGNYTSASLTTEGLVEFRYGRLEARIRVPGAQGSWPAFWLLPVNKDDYAGYPPYGSWWPAGGEIDVMEFVSQDPNRVYGTIHFLRDDAHDSSGGSEVLGEPVSSDYHVFAIEWTATTIDWFVDETHYHTFDIGSPIDGLTPFDDPFYVILNYAIGGSWPEDPDPSLYPQRMLVDWVRYWAAG